MNSQSMIITKEIYMEPKYFDSKINEHIKTKIVKQLQGNCSEEYGYITKIGDIHFLPTNKISNINSSCAFNIQVEIETILPKEGCILTGKIKIIHPEGIFIDINNNIKVFVPKNDPQLTIKNTSECIIKNDTYNVDSIINVGVVDVKYKEIVNFESDLKIKAFSCIGKLV